MIPIKIKPKLRFAKYEVIDADFKKITRRMKNNDITEIGQPREYLSILIILLFIP